MENNFQYFFKLLTSFVHTIIISIFGVIKSVTGGITEIISSVSNGIIINVCRGVIRGIKSAFILDPFFVLFLFVFYFLILMFSMFTITQNNLNAYFGLPIYFNVILYIWFIGNISFDIYDFTVDKIINRRMIFKIVFNEIPHFIVVIYTNIALLNSFEPFHFSNIINPLIKRKPELILLITFMITLISLIISAFLITLMTLYVFPKMIISSKNE